MPFDTGLRIEQRYFTEILLTTEAAMMIRSLFVSLQELNKGARRPAGIAPTKFKKIGVVGAGFMGAGIAYVTAKAGIPVVLIDRDMASAEKGKAHSDGLISDAVKKGRAKPEDKEKLLSLITPSDDYAALDGCDLVVEAVFEDSDVKKSATEKTEAVIKSTAIFASNTSTIPITSLAKNSARPKNFVGIHFFSPVDRMMLVEIILGKKTGDKALAVAMDFVRAIGKTPIVVNDTRGFYVNRCVLRYMSESYRMLIEGVPAADDRERRQAGRDAGRAAGADRRDGDRPCPEDHAPDQEGSRREGGRSGADEADRHHGRHAWPGWPQERQGFLRLPRQARQEEAVAGACRPLSAAQGRQRSMSRN